MEERSRRFGLQHGNAIDRAVFLSKRQACRGVLPNEDLPNQKWIANMEMCHADDKCSSLLPVKHLKKL